MLYDGSTMDASLFRADDSFCFPQFQEDISLEVSTMYPPFALEGLYYPQLLRYYQAYPKVLSRSNRVFLPCSVSLRSPGQCVPHAG